MSGLPDQDRGGLAAAPYGLSVRYPDTVALDLAAMVLGAGRSSRLYRAVRERRFASDVSAYNYTPTDVGVFGVSAEAPPDDARAALRAIFDTVAGTQQQITEAEVERAQNIIEARVLRSLETMEGQANFLADWQAVGNWRLGIDYFRQLMALRPAHLSEAASRYLTPERAAVITYRPQAEPALAESVDEVRSWLAA